MMNLKEKDHLLDMERDKSFRSTKTLHVAKRIKDVIYWAKKFFLKPPAFSPDLVPSDYHLFQSFQHHFTDMYLKH